MARMVFGHIKINMPNNLHDVFYAKLRSWDKSILTL